MCLISVCPKGTEKTEEKIFPFIKQGMVSNTDGSGIMWKINNHKTVNFFKGFRSARAVMDKINELNLTVNDELIIHHRIGTSGLPNDINMHPFPLTNDFEKGCKTSGKVKLPVMCHNGFFYDYTDRTSKFSDTWHFVNEFAGVPEITALLVRDHELFKTMFSATHIKGTKLAFLFPEKDLLLIGDFQENEGYYHSNGGYKSYEYNYGGRSFPAIGDRAFNKLNNLLNSRKSKNTVLADTKEAERRYELYMRGEKEENDQDCCSLIPLPSAVHNIAMQALGKFNTSMLKFNTKQIKITQDNYKHFWVVPSKKTMFIEAGGMHEIESYPETLDCFWLKECGKNVVLNIDNKSWLDICSIYVKPQYKKRYEGLFNLLKEITNLNPDGNPSRSMKKKLTNFVIEKARKESNKYKNYGVLYINDIKYYLENFTDDEPVVDAVIVATNKPVGAEFTTNDVLPLTPTDFNKLLIGGDEEPNEEGIKELGEFVDNLNQSEYVEEA